MTLDRQLLQHAGLTAFDVKMIGLIAQNGGELVYDAERAVDATAARNKGVTIANINSLADRGLISIVEITPGRYRLKLTDFGRQAATQIETMSAAPKIEVTSA
jgi:hypothetical protein